MHAWQERYGAAVLLSFGFLAVGGLCFVSGLLIGRERQADPIVIEKAVELCAVPPSSVTSTASSDTPTGEKKDAVLSAGSAPTDRDVVANCAYVGSKNSDKYHLPKCSWAKRIKPENIVCFSSASDAEAKGYKPGCVEESFVRLCSVDRISDRITAWLSKN